MKILILLVSMYVYPAAAKEMQVCADIARENFTLEQRMQTLKALVVGVQASGLPDYLYTKYVDKDNAAIYALRDGGKFLHFSETSQLRPNTAESNRALIAGGLIMAQMDYNLFGTLSPTSSHAYQTLARTLEDLEKRATGDAFRTLWSPELLIRLRQAYIKSDDHDLFKLVYMAEKNLIGREEFENFKEVSDLAQNGFVKNSMPHHSRNRMALLNSILIRLQVVTEQEENHALDGHRHYELYVLRDLRTAAVYAQLLLQIPEFTYFAISTETVNSFTALAKDLWPLLIRFTSLVPTFSEEERHHTKNIAEIRQLKTRIYEVISKSSYLSDMLSRDKPVMTSADCSAVLLR